MRITPKTLIQEKRKLIRILIQDNYTIEKINYLFMKKIRKLWTQSLNYEYPNKTSADKEVCQSQINLDKAEVCDLQKLRKIEEVLKNIRTKQNWMLKKNVMLFLNRNSDNEMKLTLKEKRL